MAGAISEYVENHHGQFDHIVATQDGHVDPGAHFSEAPDFKDTWPPHCVAGTQGAELHPELDTEHIQAYFHKGLYTAAYSGFEGLLAPEDAVPTGERQPGTLPAPERKIRLDHPAVTAPEGRRDRPRRLAPEPRRGGRRGGGPRHSTTASWPHPLMPSRQAMPSP